MINASSKQTGSAHAVIIVVIVLLILGALGFVFWQNFINKNPQPSQAPVQNEPVKEDTTVKAEQLTDSHTVPKENLTFNYPKTWTLTTLYDPKNNPGENRTLLVSPNNFALQISIPSEGPPWQFGERVIACPFDEGYNGYLGGDDNHPDVCPYYTELLSEKISNLEGLSVMAFESTWESTDIAPDIVNLTLVKTGCKIPENNLCERPPAKTGYYINVYGSYYEKISDENKKIAFIDSGYTDRKQIKGADFVKSQDVLTAIAILKSMRYQ